jgi:hypothetical protein
MSGRAKEEPLWQYWFRQFKEEPLRVMIVFTTAAMVWLYQDGNKQWEQYRNDMWEQQKLLLKHIENTNEMLHGVKLELGNCSNRLQHVERELEHTRNSNN